MKMPLKFCANLTFMFNENPSLLGRYESAKDLGFTAVECAFPYDFSIQEIVKAKERAQLKQVLINVPIGNLADNELGFAALPDKTHKFAESFSRSLQYSKALKCQLIHIMSGIVPFKTPINLEVYEKNLRKIVPVLEKEGIIGVIEPINSITVPNYFLDNFETAVEVIKKINSPYLKLQLDIFHLQHIKGNLTHNIKSLLPFVEHIQIAQVPYRNEPHTLGEINYEYIFQLLEELGYSGWIGLEYYPETTTHDGLTWLKKYGYSLDSTSQT